MLNVFYHAADHAPVNFELFTPENSDKHVKMKGVRTLNITHILCVEARQFGPLKLFLVQLKVWTQ